MEREDMTGALRGTLRQSPNLRTVNVSDNKFEGSIPSEWSDHWTSGSLDHLNLGNNLFDCPVIDYSAWGQDNDYADSYGTNGRTNCQSTSSSTTGSGMNGVAVTVIVIVAIIFVVLLVYCWRTSVVQKRKEQVAMLTEEDAFDD